MDLKSRANLLLKNSWTYKDIVNYMKLLNNNVSTKKAVEMKELAVQNGGELSYKHGHVTVDSVLSVLKTTKTKELNYLKMMGLEINEGQPDA